LERWPSSCSSGATEASTRAATADSEPFQQTGHDPKVIRTWAIANGVAVPARGRIPTSVEQQYNEATERS
jgi:hypothetical protein